jgi:hypothetical protein
MAWSIPDKGEATSDNQSILFQEYLDAIIEGINGINCVVNGGAVTAQGSPNMTVAVAKAGVISNGTLFAIAASASLAIGAADASNPRFDLIVATSAGAFAVRAGTASSTPQPPARTANDVLLAVVYVPAAATTIATTQIVDLRISRSTNVVLKKTTSPVTFNTTLAIQTYFTLTVPNGMFLAGKIIRLRCGGTYLANSGTPTWTLTISFGGTTMFADVTLATTADADRGAWAIQMDLVAAGTSSQVLSGRVEFQTPGAKTAPTTGIGDLAVTTSVITPIKGTSAVNADTANQDLLIRWTMSVSNVADETVMDYAIAELL